MRAVDGLRWTVDDRDDDGFASELHELLYRFNGDATGIRDGRTLSIAVRDADSGLVAGLCGWTWGDCGYVDVLWVRGDRRGEGMGSELLERAESEAITRGCVQMVLSTHSFQAPEFYRRRGYLERGRITDYPAGHDHIYLSKPLGVYEDAEAGPDPAAS